MFYRNSAVDFWSRLISCCCLRAAQIKPGTADQKIESQIEISWGSYFKHLQWHQYLLLSCIMAFDVSQAQYTFKCIARHSRPLSMLCQAEATHPLSE